MQEAGVLNKLIEICVGLADPYNIPRFAERDNGFQELIGQFQKAEWWHEGRYLLARAAWCRAMSDCQRQDVERGTWYSKVARIYI